MTVCSSYRCTWITGSRSRRLDATPPFHLTSSDPSIGAPLAKSISPSVMPPFSPVR